jgi:hypothetical protein
MKLASFTPTGPNVIDAIIPRGDGQQIHFRCQAVLDYEPFETLCPPPKPPIMTFPDGKTKLDYEDNKYKEKISNWGGRKIAYIIINSLNATEGLEWETVKLGDPETWENYDKELRSLYLTEAEIKYVIEKVLEANSLNEDRLEEARQSFLAARQATRSQ